jgi:23S rRNA pseudouridine1911/1915/1917 synthase
MNLETAGVFLRQEIHLIVEQDDARFRLDRFVQKHFPGDPPSRSQIKAWINDGRVLVDGSPCLKPSQGVVAGQKIQVRAGVAEDKPLPLQGEIQKVYRDDHILVLDKQAGISVHPAPSLDEPTLVNYLLERYPQVKNNFSDDRPGIVHRLDKDTTGLMVVALDEKTAATLSRSFHDREVDKEYLAIVSGCPDQDQGEINYPLGRDPGSRTKMAVVADGRQARTKFRVLHQGIDLKWSLVRLKIMTGRTHQIRAHMSRLGHPVLGDSLYGGKIKPSWDFKQKLLSKLIKRQLLHSARLDFSHPATGKRISFTKPPPKDFIRALMYLERRLQRVIITGSMGSGKSSVISMLEKTGHPVFMADKCVAELYEPGNDGWRIIRNRFGSLFIDGEDQPVNKAGIAAAVFKDKNILAELEHLIHPLVRHRLDEFWRKHRDRRVAFAEIPLVFESGMDQGCDYVVGVFCPDKVRYRRLREKRDLSVNNFTLLDKFQMSQDAKISRCALVVDNSSHQNDLTLKVEALTRALRYLRRREEGKKISFFRKMLCLTNNFQPEKVKSDPP